MTRSITHRFVRLALAACLGMPLACARNDGATASPAEASAHAELRWSDWSKDAFARAQADRRIILVNVVATWCHWCHVMEETTYVDPEVVALLREHFVVIRVDSDARPDIAERYREWGWPATGFLSPDARPVLELRGYQDPEAFAALLRELVADRDAGSLQHREPPPPAVAVGASELGEVRDRTAAILDHYFEPKLGGWGRQQRYPAPGPIEHGFIRARVTGDQTSSARSLLTLDAALALIDPVFGGMYQYSVDGDWKHPHFEKITAIQAGAIRNYAFAYRATGDAKWRTAAQDVARYMTSMMRSEDGGFFTSQDADLRQQGRPAVLGAEYYAKSDAERRALGIPRIDRAVYADLNGMMIEAFADLYAATGDAAHLEVARTSAALVLETHGDANGGIRHAANDPADGLRYLRDHVAMGRACLALYRTTGDARWLAHAEALAKAMLAGMIDETHGGFLAHTIDRDAVGVFAERRKPLEENGSAARMLALLHRYKDGDGSVATPYLDAATRALASLGAPAIIEAEGRIIGQYAAGLAEVAMPTVDVTIVGKVDDPRTGALHLAALRYPEPRAVVELDAPGNRYPDIGKPAVYLCTATACSTPITDPAKLAARADAFLATSLPPVAAGPAEVH